MAVLFREMGRMKEPEGHGRKWNILFLTLLNLRCLLLNIYIESLDFRTQLEI
jgi:hypothetical protein